MTTSMTPRLWILGASDPEMQAIERLLVAAGEYVVYRATYPDFARVRPHEAYRTDTTVINCSSPPERRSRREYDGRVTIVTVECSFPFGMDKSRHIAVDHHRPGDRGYGCPPEEYWQASSIGQVAALLAATCGLPEGWLPARADAPVTFGRVRKDPTARLLAVPAELAMVAAADHCLAAAYRGECPGVDPDALMRWRVASRAAFQGRAEREILADIEATRAALRHAPEIRLRGPADMPHTEDHDWSRSVCDGCKDAEIYVRDMRREPPWPELPEAAAREGVGYVSGPLIGPDGRRKFTCAGTTGQVRAWMEHWAPSQGLVDIYGDPARGFAGGFQP